MNMHNCSAVELHFHRMPPIQPTTRIHSASPLESNNQRKPYPH